MKLVIATVIVLACVAAASAQQQTRQSVLDFLPDYDQHYYDKWFWLSNAAAVGMTIADYESTIRAETRGAVEGNVLLRQRNSRLLSGPKYLALNAAIIGVSDLPWLQRRWPKWMNVVRFGMGAEHGIAVGLNLRF